MPSSFSYLISHGYTLSKIAVRKAKLLSPWDLRSLAEMRSLGELVSFLDITPYREELLKIEADKLSANSIESALSQHFFSSVLQIMKVSTGIVRDFLDQFLTKFEAETLKAVIRGFLSKIDPEEVLSSVIPVGIFTQEVLSRITSATSFEEFLEVIKINARKYYPSLREVYKKGLSNASETLELETAIDYFVFPILWEYVQKLGKSERERVSILVGSEIDAQNIVTIFRCKSLGIDLKDIKRYLIPIYYNVSESLLEEVILSESLDDAFQFLLKIRDYVPYIEAFRGGYAESGSFFALEHNLKRMVLEKSIEQFKLSPLHLGMIAGYYNLVYFEIRNLRAIALGIEAGLPSDRIRELLILPPSLSP